MPVRPSAPIARRRRTGSSSSSRPASRATDSGRANRPRASIARFCTSECESDRNAPMTRSRLFGLSMPPRAATHSPRISSRASSRRQPWSTGSARGSASRAERGVRGGAHPVARLGAFEQREQRRDAPRFPPVAEGLRGPSPHVGGSAFKRGHQRLEGHGPVLPAVRPGSGRQAEEHAAQQERPDVEPRAVSLGASHGQEPCPRCRARNFGVICVFERHRSTRFHVKYKDRESTSYGSSMQVLAAAAGGCAGAPALAGGRK